MWTVTLAACGVELTLDVLCVSWAAMVARHRHKGNAPDSDDHSEVHGPSTSCPDVPLAPEGTN